MKKKKKIGWSNAYWPEIEIRSARKKKSER